MIIHFYFQCVQMTMNILTSGGLTEAYLEPSQTLWSFFYKNGKTFTIFVKTLHHRLSTEF